MVNVEKTIATEERPAVPCIARSLWRSFVGLPKRSDWGRFCTQGPARARQTEQERGRMCRGQLLALLVDTVVNKLVEGEQFISFTGCHAADLHAMDPPTPADGAIIDGCILPKSLSASFWASHRHETGAMQPLLACLSCAVTHF